MTMFNKEKFDGVFEGPVEWKEDYTFEITNDDDIPLLRVLNEKGQEIYVEMEDFWQIFEYDEQGEISYWLDSNDGTKTYK